MDKRTAIWKVFVPTIPKNTLFVPTVSKKTTPSITTNKTGIINYFTSIGHINLVLWIIGILLMAGLTIKDFLPLLDDYTSNNVATQVQFNRVSNFTPPQFVQCIPVYTKNDSLMEIAKHLMNDSEECGICGKLESEGWAVWKDSNLSRFQNGGLENFYIALSLQFAKKLISEIGQDKENIFDKKFQPWNNPILKAAINFIAYWSNGDDWFGVREFQGKLKNELYQMLDEFKDSSGKMDQFFNRIMEAFCQNMGLIVLDYLNEFLEPKTANTTCKDILINQKLLPSYFEEDIGLWFPFPRQNLPKMKSYHFTLLESDVISWVSNRGLNPYIIYGDPALLYTTTLDAGLLQNNRIYQTPRPGFGLTITVKYSVQVRGRDSRPGRNLCREESIETCLAKCTNEMMIERCRCVPFGTKKGLTYDPNLPYCTYITYSACNLTTAVKTDFNEQCSANCADAPCEFISYNWQISHEFYNSVDGSNNTSEYNLIVVPLITTFTEFTWTVKNTPEQFVSQIGGILNFYLGVSGLSLVPFIILCVDFTQNRCMRREKTKRESKNGAVSEGTAEKGTQMIGTLGDSHWAESIRADMEDFKSEIRSQIFDLKNQITEIHSGVRRSKMVSNKISYKGRVF